MASDSTPEPPRDAPTGLVLAVAGLAPLVDRWRLPTVPTAAAGAPTHVTVLFPWVPGPASPADLDRLRESVRGVGPLELEFRRLGTFPGGVLFLHPEPDDGVRRLMSAVQEAFPSWAPYGGEFGDDQVPHLTVALSEPAGLSRLQQEVGEALAPHLPFRTTVRWLSVLEQQADGRWEEAHRVPLAQ